VQPNAQEAAAINAAQGVLGAQSSDPAAIAGALGQLQADMNSGDPNAAAAANGLMTLGGAIATNPEALNSPEAQQILSNYGVTGGEPAAAMKQLYDGVKNGSIPASVFDELAKAAGAAAEKPPGGGGGGSCSGGSGSGGAKGAEDKKETPPPSQPKPGEINPHKATEPPEYKDPNSELYRFQNGDMKANRDGLLNDAALKWAAEAAADKPELDKLFKEIDLKYGADKDKSDAINAVLGKIIDKIKADGNVTGPESAALKKAMTAIRDGMDPEKALNLFESTLGGVGGGDGFKSNVNEKGRTNDKAAKDKMSNTGKTNYEKVASHATAKVQENFGKVMSNVTEQGATRVAELMDRFNDEGTDKFAKSLEAMDDAKRTEFEKYLNEMTDEERDEMVTNLNEGKTMAFNESGEIEYTDPEVALGAAERTSLSIDTPTETPTETPSTTETEIEPEITETEPEPEIVEEPDVEEVVVDEE